MTFVFLVVLRLLDSASGVTDLHEDMPILESRSPEETNQACRSMPRNIPCQEWQMQKCKVTCANIAAKLQQKEVAASSEEVKGEISLMAIAADIGQKDRFALIKVARNKAWSRIWPQACAGVNSKGEQFDFDRDGFACEIKNGGKIGAVSSLMWGVRENFCCQGECSTGASAGCLKGGAKIEGLTLAEAARRAAAALPRLETDSGVHVQVSEPTQKFDAVGGMKALRELRMMGDTLGFEKGEAIFTAQSDKFLAELSKPLSVLISLQLTSMQEPGEVLKVLFCVHATTTAPDPAHTIDIKGVSLPVARANALKTRLDEFVGEGINNGVAVVGDGIAHYGMKERFGSILYKIYDSKQAAGPPPCLEDDLKLFQ